VVRSGEVSLVSVPTDDDGHVRAGSRVLQRVLDGLERAEIERGFDRRRATTDPFVLHLDWSRCPYRRRTERIRDAAIAQ